jgi:hypothetical protein
MHHTLQPDLEDFPFKTVAAFADAAEKYFIFSAIGMCKMYMLSVLYTIVSISVEANLHTSLQAASRRISCDSFRVCLQE